MGCSGSKSAKKAGEPQKQAMPAGEERSDLLVASAAEAKAAEQAPKKNTALIVATSADKMGDHATGAWSEEVCGPYFTFLDAGFDVTVCSVAGGDVPIDAGSLSGDFKTANDTRMIEEAKSAPLKGTKKLADMDVTAFDIVFFAGGHGTCVDFPTDAVGAAVAKAAAAGKVVVAVCHGPMALVKAKGPDGEPYVKGKKATCFSDTEEGMVGLTEKVPFLLEAKLKELGAELDIADPWSDKAVRDGTLVTGQNPQSSVSCAKLAVEAVAELMVVKVEIIGAKGLPNTDVQSKSDPYCTVHVSSKLATKVQTSTASDTLEPKWNHALQVSGYRLGDSLTFEVKDKDILLDDIIGSATLSDELCRKGFEGDLALSLPKADASQQAFLTVKVQATDPTLAEQAAAVVEEVKEAVAEKVEEAKEMVAEAVEDVQEKLAEVRAVIEDSSKSVTCRC